MTLTRPSLLLELRDVNNERQWTEFIRLYRPLIETTGRRYGIEGSDLDDIVQEVLIQLLRSLPVFGTRSPAAGSGTGSEGSPSTRFMMSGAGNGSPPGGCPTRL
jgi:hypothetical protein